MPCFIQNCKRPRQGDLSLLCKGHTVDLQSALLGRLKILGRMKRAEVQSFLQAHRDLKECQGDLLQLAEAQVFEDLATAWQVHVDSAGTEVKYITVHAASMVTGAIANVKQFVANNNLSPLVSAAINEDARSQRHGWRVLKNGQIGLSTFKQTFKDEKELFAHLKARSKLTHDVDAIVALYPDAASDVCKLLAADKICLVQNSTLIYVCPATTYDADALAYWKTEVFPGSFKTSQKPGHGAV